MILLERLDFDLSTAVFRLDESGIDDVDQFERLSVEAQRRGLRALLAERITAEPCADALPAARGGEGTVAVRAAGSLQTVRIVAGQPLYEIQVPHTDASLRRLSIYTALVLATFGPESADLKHLRLVLYELYANILEHGRPTRDEADLQVGIRFHPKRIEGWIQDRCTRFDPFSVGAGSGQEPKNRYRRRGYGLHIVRRLLDSSSHEFNEVGNKLTFGKEVAG